MSSTFDVVPGAPAVYDFVTPGVGAAGHGVPSTTDHTNGQALRIVGGVAAWADLPADDDAPGAWTNITVAPPWYNAAVLFSDPTIPVLGVRLAAGGGSVDIQGRIIVQPVDLVSALSAGGVLFSALIPAGFRPATKQAAPPATATVLANFSPSFFQLPLQSQVNAAGDLSLIFGTLLPDAVTDLVTYLGTLPSPGAAIVVTFSGHYPITD